MSDTLVWPKRPKWRHLESVQSYARRQCKTAGLPFDYVERGLTSRSQPDINRVWEDEPAAARIVEVAAGRPEGFYENLIRIAQPDSTHLYPARFLCRLCAGDEQVQQISHDRENWCLRHAGQMVWVGPGTTPETQAVLAFDAHQAKSERRFRRLVEAGRVNSRLHARVWEMVRDNYQFSESPVVDEPETHGRACLYAETVAVLAILSDSAIVEQWVVQPPSNLRAEIIRALPSMSGGVDVLVERIVLWLRPTRRVGHPTRLVPLEVPLDVIDTPAIIDSTASYPRWIQRNPHAVAEWDWERNEEARDPWDPIGVSRKAAWVCDKGHSWEASPSVRGSASTRCPYCVGNAVWPGHTDLGSTHPHLAAEWNTEPGQNVGSPDYVGPSSGRRISWVCRRGHVWITKIHLRANRGTRCPFCTGKRPYPGETDLATCRPDLAAEWDSSNDLSPEQVTRASGRKVTWRCARGHRWRTTVVARTKGPGCPHCAGHRVTPGETDLATLRPDLASEWGEYNDITPDQVMRSSSRVVAWRCTQGHTWTDPVARRTNGAGCPYCPRPHKRPPGGASASTST